MVGERVHIIIIRSCGSFKLWRVTKKNRYLKKNNIKRYVKKAIFPDSGFGRFPNPVSRS